MKYIRISASVLFEGSITNEKGFIKFSQSMRDKIYDKEEGFRERLILRINEETNGKWHLHFNEYPSGNFDADVFVETKEDFNMIKSILNEIFKENPLESIWMKTFDIKLFKVQ